MPEKVSRLAINVEGGFSTDDKTEWIETSRLVVLPSREEIELKNPDLPMQVSLAAAGVLTSVSATRQAQVGLGMTMILKILLILFKLISFLTDILVFKLLCVLIPDLVDVIYLLFVGFRGI